MFEYIQGTLTEANLTKVTVDIQGLGYSLWIPFNHFAKLPSLNSKVTFYVSYIVREDSQKLYGFLTRYERDLFERLIDVSGVGPKMGLALVGHMEINDLQLAITQGNVQAISKIPGIGKKTAERLIIEMRDKVKKGLDSSLPAMAGEPAEKGVVTDALSALINLGYNQAQAQKAIKSALDKTKGEPELAKLITAALRCI